MNGPTIDLTLTFRAGAAFCCSTWGCHLPLYEGKRWDWLRRNLSACGLTPAPQLELRLTVVVEAGAEFFDWSHPLPSPRGRAWYAFAPVEGSAYQTNVVECPDSEADGSGK
ncbi:MAG: hypothetical protein ACRDD1_02525 [Planctomycetia bacterium]